MLEHGTTSAEAKSGYGLDRETELKSLRAIQDAGRRSPVDVYPTFFGAHTSPPEFESAAEYVEFVIYEVLPEAAPLARSADVFLERGSFEAPEARRYLVACQEYGLALRLHADQFSERGAIPLALELGARSVDHLEATHYEAAIMLAKSDVAAVLLPACGHFLDLPLPPARLLADEGAIVALATDFNPGSSYCETLPLVMNLACTRLGFSPAESLCACTAKAPLLDCLHASDRTYKAGANYGPQAQDRDVRARGRGHREHHSHERLGLGPRPPRVGIRGRTRLYLPPDQRGRHRPARYHIRARRHRGVRQDRAREGPYRGGERRRTSASPQGLREDRPARQGQRIPVDAVSHTFV